MTGQCYAPAAFCTPADMKLAGPQNQSGCFGKEKYVLPIPGSDPNSFDIQPIA
jgi:hypothetical protein